MTKSKLFLLASNAQTSLHPQMDIKSLYISGFRKAFEIIEENLANELNRIEEYPFMGERIITLKLYKAKIAGYLKDMEQEYE